MDNFNQAKTKFWEVYNELLTTLRPYQYDTSISAKDYMAYAKALDKMYRILEKDEKREEKRKRREKLLEVKVERKRVHIYDVL